MGNLGGLLVDDTFINLLQLQNANRGIDATLRTIEDLEGTESTLQLSTTQAGITGVGGLDFIPGADIDVDLLSVNVTGAPRLKWNELADSFEINWPLIVTGNNACVELHDDSGNISRIKTGDSQLTIEADPDNAVPSTDMVFKIDGVEVGRFQQGLGFQSVKGFATQLWDILGGHWETAVINTEYYSPNQCGGIYGTIYRQYFTTALTSTNPRLDTGSIVTKMVDYVLHTQYTTSARGVGHGNMTAFGVSDNHAYLMLSGTSGGGDLSFSLTGYTVITGWVDYTK